MTKWILILALCACQTGPHSTTTPATSTAELASSRAQMIAWLTEYYERGIYPTDADGKPMSVFKDAQGVRCPMAELIFRSGHGDLVDAVVAQNNKLRLADVKDGPVYDWMATSGLTIEEIAMVQGAMDIDYSWMIQQGEQQQTILARGQVRGRLETAVTALGNGTQHSLQVQATRLAKRPVATPVAKPRAVRSVAAGNGASILHR
jgi:hypothetical protein